MKSPKIHPVLVYTDKEGIPGWWTLLINVADAAIGLRRASKNKEMWTKKTLCFTAVEPQKNVTSYRYEIFRKLLVRSYVRQLLIDGGIILKKWGTEYKKNKSDDLGPHIFCNFSDKVAVPRTRKLLPLCHTVRSESTKESIAV